MPGQGQVKGHNKAFSYFGAQGRLDGLQRGRTHATCWVNVHEGYCMSMNGILKKSRSRSGHKITIKQKSQTYRATHVFWVILHADLDGDTHLTLWRHPICLLIEVSSRSGQGQFKFSNQYFCIKSTCVLSIISSVFQICYSISYTMRRTSKNRKSKK